MPLLSLLDFALDGANSVEVMNRRLVQEMFCGWLWKRRKVPMTLF